jgi:uncharacterized membrane protein
MKGSKRGSSFFISTVGLVFMAWAILSPEPSAYGSEKKKDLPPRGIAIAPEYTGVVISEGDDISIDLTVTNKGRKDENIDLILPSVPKGWKAWFKTYSFRVTGVHVASDKSKSLTLKAEPEEDVGPGKYPFLIKAQTQDGKLTSSGQVIITVVEKKEVKKTRGINITTSYPVLEGPTDAQFEFSLEVENKLDKDTIFNLGYEGPKNWEIRFKPAYEDKYFSSLRIKADQSQTLAVEVKPYLLAESGKYPLKIKVSSPEAKSEAELTVVLTGTHKLEAGTADGRLSLTAYQGKEANLSFYVKNTGSATLSNVRFLSFKPENWKVEFKPEKMDILAPGELKQVEATITPADQALVGDYSVGLSVEGEKVSKSLELRTTVRASTAWAGIGIGIIILAIAGLVVLFIRVGRR